LGGGDGWNTRRQIFLKIFLGGGGGGGGSRRRRRRLR
jgi:hypothetical protein